MLIEARELHRAGMTMWDFHRLLRKVVCVIFLKKLHFLPYVDMLITGIKAIYIGSFYHSH